jgi:hypothetical protein
MNRRSDHGLTPEPGRAWILQAVCATDAYVDRRDLWFPKESSEAASREARKICWGCPVIEECARWAFETRQAFGVWGGIDARDRRAMLRKRGVRLIADPDEPEPEPEPESRPARPATLPQAWAQYAQPLADGHVAWDGPRGLHIDGREYSPNQISFIVDRGHQPNGIVLRTCDMQGCVLPRHLADTAERQQRAAARKAAA